MGHSYGKNLLHIVYSTKHRRPIIPRELAPELYRYLGGICAAHRCAVHAIGGMEDHVHIACTLYRTVALSDLVEELKGDSSRWMKRKGVRGFYWQTGYGGFSFGQSALARVVRYINNQERHHRELTFEAEYIELLDRYEVEYDPRYVLE
jgi:putative transposase